MGITITVMPPWRWPHAAGVRFLVLSGIGIVSADQSAKDHHGRCQGNKEESSSGFPFNAARHGFTALQMQVAASQKGGLTGDDQVTRTTAFVKTSSREDSVATRREG